MVSVYVPVSVAVEAAASEICSAGAPPPPPNAPHALPSYPSKAESVVL